MIDPRVVPSNKKDGDRAMLFSEVHKSRLHTPMHNSLFFRLGLSDHSQSKPCTNTFFLNFIL